jgi:hypothetical protein
MKGKRRVFRGAEIGVTDRRCRRRLKRRRGKRLFDGPLVTAGTAPEGNEHLPSVRGQFKGCAVVLTVWTGVRFLRRWDICGTDHNKGIFSMEADFILSFAIKSEGAWC